MADESVTFPVTPEIPKSDGILRRRSMEKSHLSESGELVLPINRRASTGSCHDICKFGKKHAIEPKERHPIIKKSTKKLIDGRHSLDPVVLPEKKKTLVHIAKPKNSSDRETRVADGTNFTNHEKIPPGSEAFDEKKKKKLLDKPKLSPHSKQQQSSIPEATKQQISLSFEKSRVFPKQDLSNAKEKKFPAKSDSSSKAKSMRVKPNDASAQRNGDVKIGESTRTLKGTAKKVLISQIVSLSPKSVNRVSDVNARKQKSLKGVTPLKNQNKGDKPKLKQARAQNVEVQEKTLYVIKMETESKPSEFNRNDNCTFDGCSSNRSSSSLKSSSPPNSISFSSHDENQTEYAANEEDNEIVNNEKDQTLNGNNKERPLKMVSPEEQESLPSKLNFRRGKVVDIQLENKSSRRLKFRRGRVLWENQKVKDAQRRNFVRRKIEGEMEDTKPAPEVVLRHQDVQGKKEAQGLFNNVIEETASKLVETRKSRVKALVGAFETVISLQERKPSANNVN